MGNKHSLGCCIYASPQPQRKSHDASTRSVLESEPCRAESTANLQHISEREPEDWNSDPSLHPKTETIFMERSRAAINGKHTSSRSIYPQYLNFFPKFMFSEGLERRKSHLQVSQLISL